MEHLTRVALDTNILLAIEKFKVDVFGQIKNQFGMVEFLVPNQVISELEAMAASKKGLSASARVALESIKNRKAKKVNIEAKNADEALLKISQKAFVASSDKKLLKKVRESNGRILILRQKKFIEAE